MVLFRVLGALAIDAADRQVVVSAAKPRTLLTALLLRPCHWVGDDELLEAIWPADRPASAIRNLRSYVSQLRGQLVEFDLGADRIERGAGGYRINVGRDELDTQVFEDLVDDARGALAAGDAATALVHVTEAVALWRGEPFDGLATDAARTEAMRLTELRWSLRDLQGSALQSVGRADEAVALLRAMVQENPLRESTWQHLMAALTSLGRRAEALDTYQRARRHFVAELGVEPGAPLRALHERLLLDEPRTERVPAEPVEAPAPTKPRRRLGRRKIVVALLVVAALMVTTGVVVSWRTITADPLTPPQAANLEAVPRDVRVQGPSPRRPIPGVPAQNPTKVLFGIGDQANIAMATELVRESPTRMLTTWFNQPQDVGRLERWRHDVVPGAYAAGFALHLIVASWDNEVVVDTEHGTGCGRPYPLSGDFLRRMRELAAAFAGNAGDPPLYVTIFHGVNTYGCAHGDFNRDSASNAYYKAIKDRYLQAREIFHVIAPNARVALGWQGWQADYDKPDVSGGRSMFAQYADALRASDFQSLLTWEPDDNVRHVRQAVRELGAFGPVMLGQYGSARFPPAPVLERDLQTLLADASIVDLTGAGLFAWNFDTQKLLTDQPAIYDFVRDVVRRNGKSAH